VACADSPALVAGALADRAGRARAAAEDAATVKVAALLFHAWNDHAEVKTPNLRVYAPVACPAGTTQAAVNLLATPAVNETGLWKVCHTFAPLLL
jgi:hypothetical protein